MGREVTRFSQRETIRVAGRVWPRAAVLDCDGLLVDTTACWHAAFQSAAAAVGRTLDGFDIRALDGASVPPAAERLSQALGTGIASSVVGEALQNAVYTLPLRPMPGAEQLLGALWSQMPLAVASNGPARTVHSALERAGLSQLIADVISGEDLGAFKPKPDVYIEACGRMAVDPSDAIAFEDSAVCAQSARAAGLTVIVVPSAPAAREHADLAVARLDDPRVFELLRLHQTSGSGG